MSRKDAKTQGSKELGARSQNPGGHVSLLNRNRPRRRPRPRKGRGASLVLIGRRIGLCRESKNQRPHN
jgi:hypothetical protein